MVATPLVVGKTIARNGRKHKHHWASLLTKDVETHRINLIKSKHSNRAENRINIFQAPNFMILWFPNQFEKPVIRSSVTQWMENNVCSQKFVRLNPVFKMCKCCHHV